jgi:peroxiredoxin
MTDQAELPYEAAMGKDDGDDRQAHGGEATSAPLDMAHRLRSFRDWLREEWPGYEEIYARFIPQLVASGAGRGGPEVGERFPDFILPNDRGQLVRLDALLSGGPLVVSFNRGHWCGFCQIELTSLNEALPRIREAGASLISIIPEPEIRARELRQSNRLEFDVLCDMDLALATQLDLTVYLGDELRNYLLADDINIGAYQRTDGWFLPIPATFVLGRDQRVLARYIDPEFRNRMAIDAILAALA